MTQSETNYLNDLELIVDEFCKEGSVNPETVKKPRIADGQRLLEWSFILLEYSFVASLREVIFAGERQAHLEVEIALGRMPPNAKNEVSLIASQLNAGIRGTSKLFVRDDLVILGLNLTVTSPEMVSVVATEIDMLPFLSQRLAVELFSMSPLIRFYSEEEATAAH